MKVSFPYEEKSSALFGKVKRPVARVRFWSKKFKKYIEYVLLVDTGADYTLLPKHASGELGINLEKDCVTLLTSGIGGKEKVYFLKEEIKIQLGNVKKTIFVGLIGRSDIPPLLGRESCLNNFDVRFFHFTTTFGNLK